MIATSSLNRHGTTFNHNKQLFDHITQLFNHISHFPTTLQKYGVLFFLQRLWGAWCDCLHETDCFSFKLHLIIPHHLLQQVLIIFAGTS